MFKRISGRPKVEWYAKDASVAFANGDLVTLTGGFAVKATAGKRIKGIANGTVTFAANNQTVARDTLNVLLAEPSETMIEIPTSATIVNADVGKFYDLTAGQIVDVATALTNETGLVVNTSDAGAATDAVIPRQLRLEKVLTSTLGVFSVV
jgi:hypothetical protein